jgi:hypothetical protein
LQSISASIERSVPENTASWQGLFHPGFIALRACGVLSGISGIWTTLGGTSPMGKADSDDRFVTGIAVEIRSDSIVSAKSE